MLLPKSTNLQTKGTPIEVSGNKFSISTRLESGMQPIFPLTYDLVLGLTKSSFCSTMAEHISITTDGYGCCVTVGGGHSTPAEPDDNDEDNAGEGPSKAVPRKRKRNPSRKQRKNGKKDISKTTKGQFPLEKVTSESLASVMTGATLIGVDPGMKSLVTAVRSDNPVDNVQLTAGIWKM